MSGLLWFAAILAALPLRTRYGHPVRALFTVMWETSLRIGTLRRLKVPEHYAKGADSLRITQDIDKARYARRMPLTARSRAPIESPYRTLDSRAAASRP